MSPADRCISLKVLTVLSVLRCTLHDLCIAALLLQKALALVSDKQRTAVKLSLSETGKHSPGPHVAALNSTQADHQPIQGRHASNTQLLGAFSPSNDHKV